MERAEEVCIKAPQRLWVWQEFDGGNDPHRSDRPRRLSSIGQGRRGRDEATLQLLCHEHTLVHDVWMQVGKKGDKTSAMMTRGAGLGKILLKCI